jgi:hypothetical protein
MTRRLARGTTDARLACAEFTLEGEAPAEPARGSTYGTNGVTRYGYLYPRAEILIRVHPWFNHLLNDKTECGHM